MRCLTLAEAYGHVTSKHFCLSNSSGDNNVAYSSLMEIRRKRIEPIVILIVERISALYSSNKILTQTKLFFSQTMKFWKYIVEEEIREKGLIKVNKVSLINSISSYFRSFLLSIYFFINFSLISQSGKTFIFTNYLVKR